MDARLSGPSAMERAPPPSSSQRTSAIARGLKLLLDHHGCPTAVQDDIERQLHSYLDSCDEGIWLKRMKYVLTYPMSLYLRNELPPAPDVVIHFTGAAWGWMHPRLKIFSRRNTHLWYSWLQAKRSALAASDDLIHQAYEKHREMLTSADRGVQSTIDAIFDDPTFRKVIEDVRDAITKTYRDNFTELFPSRNACYEFARSDGGQAEFLQRLVGDEHIGLGLDRIVRTAQRQDRLHYGELYRMRFIGRIRAGVYRLETFEERYNPCPEWNEKLRTALLLCDFDRLAPAMIQAVLEPMKIRIISKGPALEYYSVKPVQRAMHDVMRKMNCFRAIGRPLSATDVEEIAAKATTEDVWFSIDYSAATDGLSWKYSGRIMREILKDLPFDVYRRCEQVLGPHTLEYPKNQVRSGVMQSGQLMGSILSFPILCLANLGVYLYTTRYHQAFWSDEERLNAVLINGDDMVYAAPKELWNEHILHGRDVGLEMSVGKAYHHHTYVNINSTSYHLDLRAVKHYAYKIGYLNTGLFYGQHKVMNRDVAQAHMNGASEGVVANYNVVMDGALPGKGALLHARWIHANEEAIRRECLAVVHKRQKTDKFTRNLFLPISCGGMGCVPPAGVKFKVTLLQKQIAYSLVPNRCCFGSPLTGKEVLDVLPWKRLPNDVNLVESKDELRHYRAGKAALPKALCVLGIVPCNSAVAVQAEEREAWVYNPLL